MIGRFAPGWVLVLVGCAGAADAEPTVDDAATETTVVDEDTAFSETEPVDDTGTLTETSAPDAPDVAVDAAPTGATMRIVVLSDLNGSYGSTTYESTVHGAVKAVVDKAKPDLVLITGDMVAGQQAGLNYKAMWNGFHSAVTTPLTTAGIPVAVTPGNHDASGYASFASERTEFVAQWKAREPKVTFVDKTNFPLRYSFVHKGAFFISLDATTIATLSAEQRAWVDAQLAAAPQKIKIAYGHVPIHPVAIGRETEVTNDLELEKIFAKRGLTMLISGHHHAYYPGAAGGVRQIVMSCTGAGPRALIGTSPIADKAFLRIDIAADKVTAVDAYEAPAFDATIKRSTLPGKLTYGAHTVTRDDLAGF